MYVAMYEDLGMNDKELLIMGLNFRALNTCQVICQASSRNV